MMTVQKSFLEEQKTIIKMISSSIPLMETLNYIVRCIENHCDEDHVSGAIMLYNPVSDTLAQSVSASLPETFISAIGPVEISPYGGASGTAAFLKKSISIPDIENNPLCDAYRHMAIIHGFRACLSIPLLSSKRELLGTLELYFKNIGGPNNGTSKKIELLSKLASLAIEVSNTNNQLLVYAYVRDYLWKDKREQRRSLFLNYIQR